MDEIKDFLVWVLGGIVGILSWVFRRQIKRIDDLELEVQRIDNELKLNSEKDKHMKEAVEEIKKGQEETKTLLVEFLKKYAFVLDKQVKKEMEK